MKQLQCFQKKDDKLDFHTYCISHISQMSQMSDLRRFIETVTQIFALLQSDYENEYTTKFSQNLKLIFEEKYSALKLEMQDSDDFKQLLEIILPELPQPVTEFFSKCSEEANCFCLPPEVLIRISNGLSCKDFVPEFITICSHFPLWCSFLNGKSTIINTNNNSCYLGGIN